MKKILMLASLLAMGLGVSPSFAKSTVNTMSDTELYLPVMTCLDETRSTVMIVSLSLSDIGKYIRKKYAKNTPAINKVEAIVTVATKAFVYPVMRIKGDLIFDTTARSRGGDTVSFTSVVAIRSSVLKTAGMYTVNASVGLADFKKRKGNMKIGNNDLKLTCDRAI